MLLAGDIFDGEPTRETVEALKKALSECGARVFITPGNHDFCAPGSLWLEESWPENVYVFTRGLEAVTIPGLNCRVYGAGYQSMDSAPLLENFRAEGSEKYCIAVLHGDPTRKDSPYCPITAQQVRESGLQYLALGHIHKAVSYTHLDVYKRQVVYHYMEQLRSKYSRRVEKSDKKVFSRWNFANQQRKKRPCPVQIAGRRRGSQYGAFLIEIKNPNPSRLEQVRISLFWWTI